MKIAIHHREGSFSDRWIQYCIFQKLKYQIVNCFETTILETLKNEKITHLLWHLNHSSSNEVYYGKIILNAIDQIGVKTFPNFNTRWHFDDKIAQKYLLESVNAPLVKSSVYYSKEESLNAINNIELPIVAKLKRGAGSTNVFLLKSKEEAIEYINKMFGAGIVSTSKSLENFDQKLRIAKKIKNPKTLFDKTLQYFIKNRRERRLSIPEKGYFYFQEFLPDNDYDTRIIVVGDIAFGIRRINKKNDFRASGSGLIDYDVEKIDIRCVEIAFHVSNCISSNSLAFDFVFDKNKKPKIIEVCFGFSMIAYDNCKGYWKKDLSFVSGVFNPQYIMIENFINE